MHPREVCVILEAGDKVLVCHRRLFHDDPPRFFVGAVVDYEDGIAKATGYSWTRDPGQSFVRKPDERTKLVAIGSGTLIVYQIPTTVDLSALRLDQSSGLTVILRDGQGFEMDISERIAHAH